MAQRIIAVFGPDNRYLSHCTEKRATNLIDSRRATRVNVSTIKLTYTKKGWVSVKHNIIEDSNRICYICNRRIPEEEIATIDHVIPSSRSTQANTFDNLQCCCERCNHDKDRMKLTEYVRHIKINRGDYEYISDEILESLQEFAFRHEKDFYLNDSNLIYTHKKKKNNKKRKENTR